MIEELAALVEAIDAAAKSADALPALLATLRNSKNGLFGDVVVLKNTLEDSAFVVSGSLEASVSNRTWMRWPMRRLFAAMKPARITNPCVKSRHALAIPLSYVRQRYVVLAVLTPQANHGDCEVFFEILEAIAVPGRQQSEAVSAEVPAAPMEPVIVAFALCDDLYASIDNTLGQRGWPVERIENFRDLWKRFQRGVPDVIAVDLELIESPITALLAIHRAANSAALRILAFGSAKVDQHGFAALADRILPHDSGREAVFKSLKQLARDAMLLRRVNSVDADVTVKRQVRTTLSLEELVQLGAERASDVVSGWACCVLIDGHGRIYRMEHPQLPEAVFATVPKSFLGDACFDLRVGDRFLQEVTEHAAERMALMSLKPLSGASVPIVAHGGERCGVLVACALHRSSDSATFESLERLARIIAERYEALGPARVVIPEFRQEPYWERLRDRPFGIDVYRSTDCRIPWHYRPVTETSRLLTFGVKVSEKLAPWLAGRRGPELSDAVHELVTARSNAPSFAAAIDLSSESMTYAACGFTPPISFVARGPMGSFRTTADDVTMGTATLRSPGEAAIFDSQLWRWVSARNDAAQIRTLLEKETPSGLASLVTLGL